MTTAAIYVGVTLMWCGAFAAEWLREPDKRGRLARGTITRALPRPIADAWQIGEMALAGVVVLAACVIVAVWSVCLGVADWLRGRAGRRLTRR